jgi:glycosyltransferase involved in cell wall biosynthesis
MRRAGRLGSSSSNIGATCVIAHAFRHPRNALLEPFLVPMLGNVCICGAHLSRGYSGGRYHAWILGEALAAGSCAVTLWTTAVPEYAADFENYPAHRHIRSHLDPEFLNPPRGAFDWVVVIPDRGSPLTVYERWLLFAFRHRARLALLNFESPNWFNALSGTPADPSLWAGWRLVSRHCDVIISSADESTRWAKSFYTKVRTSCRFSSCPPAINSKVADSVVSVAKAQQICVIARLGGTNYAHKGGFDLVEAIGPAMAGFELVFLVGMSTVQEDILAAVKARAAQHDLRLRFINGATDLEKFTEIKRSRLTLFLSRFEGFGYPPVESLYCGTPCIAYDLPVLREISGDGLIYVPAGDFDTLRAAIDKVLHGPPTGGAWLRAQVEHVACFESFVARVSEAFDPAGAAPPIGRAGFMFRARLEVLTLLARWRGRLRALRRRVRRVVSSRRGRQ